MPESLRAEQRAVEAMIYERFRGVTREGGVSWSESEVIDVSYPASIEERLAARALDNEPRWEELVEASNWDPETALGGFFFLDAIGFRYYLAPAMVRSTRLGFSERLTYRLRIPSEGEDGRTYGLLTVSLLDHAQCQAVARFVRFMVAMSEWWKSTNRWGGDWKPTLESYWDQFV